MATAPLSELPDPPPLPRQGELTAHRAPLPALTGIRFFAAMYVVFYHSHLPEALDLHHLSAAATMIRNGLLAVPLFFILSGFILSYTYEGQIGRVRGYRRFWEARFARVWPLYTLSLLFSSAVNQTTPHSWLVALATLGMVQAWDPFNMSVAGSWNFVCWTLSTEAFFYLCFPPIQQWLERRRTSLVLAALVVLSGIAVAGATGGINYADTRGISFIPLAVVHVPEFLSGVCAGNLFLRFRSRPGLIRTRAGTGWATYACVVLVFALLCQPLRGLATWTTPAFAVLLFCLAAERSALEWLLSTPLLLLGGQISFGIYLLQWPCKTAVNLVCDRLHLASLPARFLLDCAVLSLVSAAGFYGVEEPARRMIRSFFSRAQSRPAGNHP